MDPAPAPVRDLPANLACIFGANYHVAPQAVLDSIAEYRAHFTPSPTLSDPYVAVSPDVLTAPTETQAIAIGAGYAEWVHSIRTGQGAIPYPSPENAKSVQDLAPEQRALVQDRIDTRFVGDPAQVSESLRTLQRATGANELILTTVAHHHADRVRSQELLSNT